MQSRRRQVLVTDAMLVAMALIWAVNYSVLKFGTRLVPPLAYNGVRIPAAALLQFGIARAMRLGPISRKDAIQLVVLGMLGNGIYQVFFILGQARSRVATTVLVLASGPALAAILGRLRGTERLSRRSWSGIGLQLVGVSCVVLALPASPGPGQLVRQRAGLRVGGKLGALLGHGTAAHEARPRTPGRRLHHAWWRTGVVPRRRAIDRNRVVDRVVTALYGAIAYSTIGAMVIAYSVLVPGRETLGPTHTPMYSNMQPLLAMAVAWGRWAKRRRDGRSPARRSS
jgi:drug/metabolite transporter (DMT)-like permease